VPLHHLKEKENQYKIRKIKEKKNKIVSVQASHNIKEGNTSYTSVNLYNFCSVFAHE